MTAMSPSTILAGTAALIWRLLLVAVAAAPCARAADKVSIRNLDPPGAFAVVNSGPAVSLKTRLSVERLDGGNWVPVEAVVDLVAVCNMPPIPSCTTLAAGATLAPPRWNGLQCGGQCAEGCRANAYHGPGRFRFMATSCDGGATFAGPPFDLPGAAPK